MFGSIASRLEVKEPAEAPGASRACGVAGLPGQAFGLRLGEELGHPKLYEIKFPVVHGRLPLSSFHPFVADRNDSTNERPSDTS